MRGYPILPGQKDRGGHVLDNGPQDLLAFPQRNLGALPLRDVLKQSAYHPSSGNEPRLTARFNPPDGPVRKRHPHFNPVRLPCLKRMPESFHEARPVVDVYRGQGFFLRHWRARRHAVQGERTVRCGEFTRFRYTLPGSGARGFERELKRSSLSRSASSARFRSVISSTSPATTCFPETDRRSPRASRHRTDPSRNGTRHSNMKGCAVSKVWRRASSRRDRSSGCTRASATSCVTGVPGSMPMKPQCPIRCPEFPGFQRYLPGSGAGGFERKF